jgi:hypothetical protein
MSLPAASSEFAIGITRCAAEILTTATVGAWCSTSWWCWCHVGRLGCGSTSASTLATVRRKTVTIRLAAVAVLAVRIRQLFLQHHVKFVNVPAASSKCAVGVTSGATEILSAPSVRSRGGSSWRCWCGRLFWCWGGVAATRDASGSAMSWGVSTLLGLAVCTHGSSRHAPTYPAI